jgi:hypothetical protein
VIPICEIVRLEPPVLVRVSESFCEAPTCTVPKLKLAGFDPTAPGATPVPERGKISDGLGASEVTVTLPLALPVDWGEKVAVNVVLCETFRASGVVIPLTENPVPVAATCEMLTVAGLLLVSVTV